MPDAAEVDSHLPFEPVEAPLHWLNDLSVEEVPDILCDLFDELPVGCDLEGRKGDEADRPQHRGYSLATFGSRHRLGIGRRLCSIPNRGQRDFRLCGARRDCRGHLLGGTSKGRYLAASGFRSTTEPGDLACACLGRATQTCDLSRRCVGSRPDSGHLFLWGSRTCGLADPENPFADTDRALLQFVEIAHGFAEALAQLDELLLGKHPDGNREHTADNASECLGCPGVLLEPTQHGAEVSTCLLELGRQELAKAGAEIVDFGIEHLELAWKSLAVEAGGALGPLVERR